MKKFFVLLALALSLQVANAQQNVKSVAAAKSAVEKAEAAANDAKKAAKVATWIKLGQSYMDAFYAPQGNAWVGATAQDLAFIMAGEKPSSEEQAVVAGQPFLKQVFENHNYYFNGNGQLALIEVTKPVVDNVLTKALEAYKMAAKVDEKGSKTKDIVAAVQTISAKFSDEAYNAYTFGDMEKASEMFQLAAESSMCMPGVVVDTNSVYNTAYTAYAVGNLARAKEWFEKSIAIGYDGENGEAYAKLADIADKQGDTEASKSILENAFIKYPQSQSILIGLINYYVSSKTDTDRLFELLDDAKKNEPNNASLYYTEGNIRAQLGDIEGAVVAYDKCAEVNPDYDFGYIGKGILYYNQAVALQEKANEELDDAKWNQLMQELQVALKNCIPPFETAFNITKDDSLKGSIAEYLKNACFRFRTESDEYAQKYETYAAACAK